MTPRGRTSAHALLTDEPGLLVHSPRRQLVRLLVLYAVLPLICAAAGAFIAYELAGAAMDRRVEALESDLAGRRAASVEADRQRDARLAQTRRDLCVVVDRVQPRDKAIEDVRRRYGCTTELAGSPSPTPGQRGVSAGPRDRSGGVGTRPGAAPAPVPVPAGPRGSGGVGRPSPPPSPAPAPPPPPPPGPGPSPEPELKLRVDVCVPLLNLCV